MRPQRTCLLSEAEGAGVAEGEVGETAGSQNMLDFTRDMKEFGCYSLGRCFPMRLCIRITGEL